MSMKSKCPYFGKIGLQQVDLFRRHRYYQSFWRVGGEYEYIEEF